MDHYEVQVLDCFENSTYSDGVTGAVYGQWPPLVNACMPPGEWQICEIVFRRPHFAADGRLLKAARLTVFLNGVLVQDGVELWGPTNWLEPDAYRAHADRLPLRLQDHGAAVRFRNIWARELPPLPDSATEPAESSDLIELSAEQLRPFVGVYGHDETPVARVGLEKGRLQFEFVERRFDLMAETETRFVLRRTDATVEFEPNENGGPIGLSFTIGGDQQRMQRL